MDTNRQKLTFIKIKLVWLIQKIVNPQLELMILIARKLKRII